MQHDPRANGSEDTDEPETRDDVDELQDLMSGDRLLTVWARRPGPTDI